MSNVVILKNCSNLHGNWYAKYLLFTICTLLSCCTLVLRELRASLTLIALGRKYCIVEQDIRELNMSVRNHSVTVCKEMPADLPVWCWRQGFQVTQRHVQRYHLTCCVSLWADAVMLAREAQELIRQRFYWAAVGRSGCSDTVSEWKPAVAVKVSQG